MEGIISESSKTHLKRNIFKHQLLCVWKMGTESSIPSPHAKLDQVPVTP